MSTKNKQNKNKQRSPKVVNRKQLRKEKRQQKKINRNEYYTNRIKPTNIENCEAQSKSPKSDSNEQQTKKQQKSSQKPSVKPKLEISQKIGKTTMVRSTEYQRAKEKKVLKNLKRDMRKQRKEQLLEANLEEDKNIKRLEKQLKLHKRKSKSIPKSFVTDGLDYLLEVCDPDSMRKAVIAEKEFNDVNDEFEEDFALMTSESPIKNEKKQSKKQKHEDSEEESGSDFGDELNEDEEFELGYDSKYRKPKSNKREGQSMKNEEKSKSETSDSEMEKEFEPEYKTEDKKPNRWKNKEIEEGDSSDPEDCLNEDNVFEDSESEEYSEDEVEYQNDENEESENEEFGESSEEENQKGTNKVSNKNSPTKEKKNNKPKKRRPEDDNLTNKSKKKKKENLSDEHEGSADEVGSDANHGNMEEFETSTIKGATKVNADGTWEDIYGRVRNADGSIASKKYVPPSVRAKMEASGSPSEKKQESLNRLRKQLKGLLNRLAESNMHSIATQIENLYMKNSRNDMNDTLTALILESVMSNVVTPERLLMEHVLLVTVLHANVGTEVGAHFLQTAIKKFDEFSKSSREMDNKSLDNAVNVLAQLYNFKLFDAKLLHEILKRLSGSFQEKDVECILHILRSVGFGLRKDDPLALKNLILGLQKQAADASDEVRDNARVKFMLDILLAIKNNNVTKIPNYDTSYSEHLKKIMKGFIRKGNYVTQLNISLDDLLKAEERGRWWVVGSAWTGNSESGNEEIKSPIKTDGYSTQLLELARKQRMNTDTRRNIFCILMTAEDYLDAFEKLLRLGLKNQQKREIIHVILHCSLQERKYNPYYAVLAQKFCDYDRMYQMTIKYTVWDKLKALNEQSASQISNLAKLLTHLFIEKGLPISMLKIVQFSELDKITLRFMRQILIGILLHKEVELVQDVFLKVALSDKLKMFRESLRLFVHHFLLKNLNSENIPEDKKELLVERAKMVEKVLTRKEGRVKF